MKPKRLLYLSPINWNFIKQRPQFLAAYAAENGFDVTFLSRTPWGKGLFRSRRTAVSANLTAVNICVLPLALRFPLIEKFNNFRLKRLIAGEKFDLIIVGDPRLAGVLPENSAIPVFFDCMDNYPDFYSGKIREAISRQQKRLCRLAGGIIVSARKLKDILVREYAADPEKITLIRNAAADDFPEKAKVAADGKITPADMLYAGTVDHWFDWEAVVGFARKYPERSIRIAGPLAVPPPENLPENIELYGKVPHSQIPGLIRNAKLMIIPFVKNPLIEAVDPVKLYEYLSLGKRVLSAYWEELENFQPEPRLIFYSDSGDFAGKAAALLDNPPETDDTPDAGFHAKNNWSTRGKCLTDFINLKIEEKYSR